MKLNLCIIGLLALTATSFSVENGEILLILSGQSNMQGMNEQLTFVPRVQEKYGTNNILIVKEAIGGRPIGMWIHDREAAPDWTVNPDITNTKYTFTAKRLHSRS